MNIKNNLATITKSRFVLNTTKLATGTALAQMLSLAFLPILTRKYSQDAFGFLATFSTVVGFISSFATLKYDTALILPKKNRDAYSLLKLSNIVTFIITTICVLIIFLPFNYFDEYRGLEILIGIGVILTINNNNSALWNIRIKHFNTTSISKIIQSISIFFFQYILFSVYQYKGLIIGNILGLTISGFYLLITRKFDWGIYKSITHHEMTIQAKRYIDFPRYFTFTNAILSFSSSLPVLFFVKYIPMSQIGLYGIAIKVIGQPVTLISNSIRSVILGDMAHKKNNNKPIIKWYLYILVGLLIISLIISFILLIVSEQLVTLFLGKEWINSAVYIKMLLPLLISMMIASPGIAAVRVYEMQKYSLIYSIFSLCIKGGLLIILFSYQLVSFEYIILIYALSNLILVIINNCIILNKINKYETISQNSNK